MGAEAKPALPLILKVGRNEYRNPNSRYENYDPVTLGIRANALQAIGEIGVRTQEVIRCLEQGKRVRDLFVSRAAESALNRLTQK
jgi:hypothetical protein